MTETQLSTSIVEMTPEWADDLLKLNTENRAIRPYVVDYYAEQMKAGMWKLTHQGVAVTSDNIILDGQHRLLAVVKAQVSVPMCISRNVPKQAFMCMDTGVKRITADLLRIDLRLAAVATRIAHTLSGNTGGSSRVPVHKVKKIAEAIEKDFNIVVQCCPTRRGPYSSVPMLLAALLSYADPTNDKNYVISTYTSLVQSDLDSLPPVGQALISYTLNNERKKKSNEWDLFRRGVTVLSVFNQRNTAIFIKRSGETGQERCRQLYEKIYGVDAPTEAL